ncbi:MAG: hypothetical protein E7077_13500 [Bacteroidales bacterium]|jgi:hypothetical protein|nr:hypothetical protein [Bacteroidales bacterium]
MKKLFNLSLALSVFASPLFLTSCEDEDTDNKEQIISEEKDQTYNIQPGVPVSSIKAYVGDTYVIDNESLGITGVSVSITKVEDSFITFTVTGTTITISDSDDLMSCVLYDAKDKDYVEASRAEAIANPENVLFVCQNGSFLVSGTESDLADIRNGAGKTIFKKWDYLY